MLKIMQKRGVVDFPQKAIDKGKVKKPVGEVQIALDKKGLFHLSGKSLVLFFFAAATFLGSVGSCASLAALFFAFMLAVLTMSKFLFGGGSG